MLIDWPWFVPSIGVYSSIGRPVVSPYYFFLVAQSADSLQAGRPEHLYQISSSPPPLLAEHSGEWPGEPPKLDGAILGSAEGEQGVCLSSPSQSELIVWYVVEVKRGRKKETARNLLRGQGEV